MQFDEDQFDGYVSSNVKSKYDYFNDIQPNDQQNDQEEYEFGDYHTDVMQQPVEVQNQQQFPQPPHAQLELNLISQQVHSVVPNLMQMYGQSYSPTHQVEGKIDAPNQTNLSPSIQLLNLGQLQNGSVLLDQQPNVEQQIVSQELPQILNTSVPPNLIHFSDQKSDQIYESANELEQQPVPQQSNIKALPDLMQFYDEYQQVQQVDQKSISEQQQNLQVEEKPSVLPNLMQLYSSERQIVEEKTKIQEQKQQQVEKRPSVLPNLMQLYDQQTEVVEEKTTNLIQEQQQQQVEQKPSVLPNLMQLYDQQPQVVEEKATNLIQEQQLLQQVEQKPNVLPNLLYDQEISIKTSELIQEQQTISQQVEQKPSVLPNLMQFYNEQILVTNNYQQQIPQESSLPIQLYEQQSQINNFQQKQDVLINQDVSLDKEPNIMQQIVHDSQKQVQDSEEIEDEFDDFVEGEQIEQLVERRKWREQIEDIVGLDADCMIDYIKELEELKLDVYREKALEYAQLARDIQTLRKKKQDHVDREEYEEATVIRDTLRAKEPIAMQLKKKILEIAKVMDMMNGQPLTQELPALLPKVYCSDFMLKLKKELKKSESVLQIIKLQGQLEKVRYEKKFQNFILGLRKIIGMSYRFEELNDCVKSVNDRLSDLKLEREIAKIDYEYIFENTVIPQLKGQPQVQYYCNFCFMAKKDLIEYKGQYYDVCCLNFYYSIN